MTDQNTPPRLGARGAGGEMPEGRAGGGPSGEGGGLQRRPIYPHPPAASGGSAAEPAGTHPPPPDPPPWYTRDSVIRPRYPTTWSTLHHEAISLPNGVRRICGRTRRHPPAP